MLLSCTSPLFPEQGNQVDICCDRQHIEKRHSKLQGHLTYKQISRLSDFILQQHAHFDMADHPFQQGPAAPAARIHQCETYTFHSFCGHVKVTHGCHNPECRVVALLEVRYVNVACEDCLLIVGSPWRRHHRRRMVAPRELARRRIRYRRIANLSDPEAVYADAIARYEVLSRRPSFVHSYYSLDGNAGIPSVLGDFDEAKAIHTRECGICCSEFDDAHSTAADSIAQLPCGHLFGRTCIMQWLTDHDSCPFCRTTWQIRRWRGLV